jgi:hypothetical protein
MRTRWIVATVALMCCVLPVAQATLLTVSDSETSTLLFNTAVYQVTVNNGGQIVTGQTYFLTPSSSTAAGTTLVLTGYSIPSGSTLNSATLDVTPTINAGALSYTMTGTGGTVGSWRPTFDSTSSDLILTVSSGAVSMTVNAASLSDLDLIAAGFSSPLLAGEPISITWSQTISVSASTAGYTGGNWRSATRQFNLSQSNSTTLAGFLEIDFTEPVSDSPEPATYLLVAAGLLALARLRK